jgi:hypothetical protein
VRSFKRACGFDTVDNQGYRDALRLHPCRGTGSKVSYDAPARGRKGQCRCSKGGRGFRSASAPLFSTLRPQCRRGFATVIIQGPRHERNYFKQLPICSQYPGAGLPIVDLATHIGIKPQWSEEHAAFLVSHSTDRLRTAGMLAGDFGGDDDPMYSSVRRSIPGRPVTLTSTCSAIQRCTICAVQ